MSANRSESGVLFVRMSPLLHAAVTEAARRNCLPASSWARQLLAREIGYTPPVGQPHRRKTEGSNGAA
jgi:predicted HicB family RNase H-like nuclease